jgi:CPA1 family monovalent cation:H+ antiporter
VTGLAVHGALGIPLLVALVFGAVVAATDPISVLAIFKDIAVINRLAVIVEGESLFNDGTALVIFRILLAAAATGTLSVRSGVEEFAIAVLGGGVTGIGLGYVFSTITHQIDDPQVEITLTTILAYAAYLAAEALHMSGVVATVAGGLMIGNLGARYGMSPRTRIALWSFWGYASFVINSIVFLLIGLQVRLGDLLIGWRSVVVAVSAVVLGRMLAVYSLVPLSGMFGSRIPRSWQHALVLGGMRGALSLTLALSLPAQFPYRSEIMAMTFGVVAFTIIAQGLSMKPVLRRLGIASSAEGELERSRVRQLALAAAQSELDQMARQHLLSEPAYAYLRGELEAKLTDARAQIGRLVEGDAARLSEEMQLAKARLVAAQQSSIEQAMHHGFISPHGATSMIGAIDRELDELLRPGADRRGGEERKPGNSA